MRARIFRRFLTSAFLLFVGTLFISGIYLVRFTADAQMDALEKRLQSETKLLLVSPPGPNGLEAWVEEAAERTGDGIAILRPDGSLAAAAGAGASEVWTGPASGTHKNAAGMEYDYVSASMGALSLRVNATTQEVRGVVEALRIRLLSASLVSTILVALIAAIFMRSFARRVERIRQYVEGLLDARLPEGQLPAGDDELGALAESLRRMAPRVRDLVDRLKVEGARREAILASMVEGVLAIDKDLRVTFCNDSFARIAGTRTPVPTGMVLTDLVRDPGLLEIMTRVLATGERVERRVTLPAQAHSFEVLAGPLAGASDRGALAILHDITKLERLERVRKDFVANVSHELRTPLASIRGYAETLLDGALEDQEHNHKFVEIILAQSIRLNNIASDLLTLSELEAGKDAALQPKRISVRSTLEAALRTVEAAARVQKVRLVTGCIEDVWVRGQEIRMEQALVNLVDNAVKFNKPDGEVRIEAKEVEGTVEIAISDTGIGIPSEDLPRVFERFYRVDKARSRQVGGTGLGLSIVRHVVEQMGGTVSVQSILGKGSRFTIAFPPA